MNEQKAIESSRWRDEASWLGYFAINEQETIKSAWWRYHVSSHGLLNEEDVKAFCFTGSCDF